MSLGYFYTPYAAAVTAALSKTKGLQDQRDATLLSGCLTTEQAEQAAEKEGLTLGSNTSAASGFTNVTLGQATEHTLRPFTIRPRVLLRMPSGIARSYTSGGHATLRGVSARNPEFEGPAGARCRWKLANRRRR